MFGFGKKADRRFYEAQGFDYIHDFEIKDPQHQRNIIGWYHVNEPCYFYVMDNRRRPTDTQLRRRDGSAVLFRGDRLVFQKGDFIYIDVRPCELRDMKDQLITAVTALFGARNKPDPQQLFYKDNVAITTSEVVNRLQQSMLTPVAWSRKDKRFFVIK